MKSKTIGDEKKYFESWVVERETDYKAQREHLLKIGNPHSVAKIYCDSLADCVRLTNQFRNELERGFTPPGISMGLHEKMIEHAIYMMNRKNDDIKWYFEYRFKEPISSYVDESGNMRGMFSTMKNIWKNR